MKLRNFVIESEVEITADDRWLDLHNNYNFVSLDYNVFERKLTLTWIRSKGDWVDKSLPLGVELAMEDVYHFEASPRDSEMPFTEDDCLEAFLSITKGEDGQNYFMDETTPSTGCLFGLSFQSGLVLAVGAEEASVVLR